MKRWSRYNSKSAVTKYEAHRLITILSEKFKIKRPTVLFFNRMTDALGYYLWPNCYIIRLLVNRSSGNKLAIHSVCHEFAHHLDYMKRGETNHGLTYRKRLSQVYRVTERLCVK